MKGQKITIYGDGSQSRSFLHIDDNIAFTNIVLEKDLFINEVVNVGSDDVISIKNLALLIKDITESDSELVFLPPLKDGDMYRRKPDVTKMRLHMNTLTPLDKGITKTIDAS